MRRMKAKMAAVALCAAAGSTHAAFAQRLTTELVMNGLARPVFLTQAPGDSSRFFVLEQHAGLIRVIKDGVLLPDPFLSLAGQVATGNEQGLLGLAFHPDYANNGYFFINYTNRSGDTIVERYRVSGNPDVADPDSDELILEIDQPFSNHNAGMLDFGPDGYLYVGTGDGGSAGDPGNRAQNGQSLLGKMLRLDVDNGLPYTIPADNPFVNDPNVLDEIWALGFRNPWRYSFDRLTGDLWIGDVGQGQWEEIDFQPAESDGGENYGWRLKEGTHCFNPPTDCDPGGLTDPIYEYQHTFIPSRCSVTGGFVYRGEAIPLLHGTYFFADYCSNEIWSLRYNQDTGQVEDLLDRTAELDPDGPLDIRSIVSFGEDNDGELYVLEQSGEIFKIVTEMRVVVGPIIAGQSNTFEVKGATPGQRVYFVYSTAGPGATPVPPLGVTLALDRPVLGGSARANADGEASFSRFIPSRASGVDVWIQTAENGNTSNVIRRTVQ